MYDWKKWEIKTILKKDFPEQLLKIKNCPEKLYYRGNWGKNLFEKTLVVVGSRRMTRYGREVVTKFMPDLVANKLTIVSGFMYGVDTEAHNQCIELGGKTIAVLGSGLNYLTTIENDELYTKILESGGLVISEYEPEFKATVWSFPQRNRIVAGLATEGVLIIEAGMKSGSLITARLGKEMGKPVLAIPGQMDSSSSEGSNWLIKTGGAKMVTVIEDILDKPKISQEKLFEVELNNEENQIWKLLETEPLTVDEIAKKLKCGVSEVSITVSMMAMKSLIDEEMGKIYKK